MEKINRDGVRYLPFPLLPELRKLQAIKPEKLLSDEKVRLRQLLKAREVFEHQGAIFNGAMDSGNTDAAARSLRVIFQEVKGAK